MRKLIRIFLSLLLLLNALGTINLTSFAETSCIINNGNPFRLNTDEKSFTIDISASDGKIIDNPNQKYYVKIDDKPASALKVQGSNRAPTKYDFTAPGGHITVYRFTPPVPPSLTVSVFQDSEYKTEICSKSIPVDSGAVNGTGGCQIPVPDPNLLKPGNTIHFQILPNNPPISGTFDFFIQQGGAAPAFSKTGISSSDLLTNGVDVSEGLREGHGYIALLKNETITGSTGDTVMCQSQSFSINNDPTKAGKGTLCTVCINQSSWDESSGTCTGGAGGSSNASQVQCDDTIPCNHSLGCFNSVNSPYCPPPYKKDSNGNCSATSFNPCPAPNTVDANGNCSGVNTGLGISLASEKTSFATSLMGVILSIAGLIALFIIITTGYRLMTSQGDPEKIKGARESLTAAIVGLIFVIFSLAVLSFIGFDLLQVPGIGK